MITKLYCPKKTGESSNRVFTYKFVIGEFHYAPSIELHVDDTYVAIDYNMTYGMLLLLFPDGVPRWVHHLGVEEM